MLRLFVLIDAIGFVCYDMAQDNIMVNCRVNNTYRYYPHHRG